MRPPTHFGLEEGKRDLDAKAAKNRGNHQDDASMLRAAGDLLDAHGFATLAFASAEEFRARGAAKHVDCLLLDIDLGGMSGIASASTQRFSFNPSDHFMTAPDDEAIERRALETGCVAFLRKPFSRRALVDAIGKAVA